MTQRDLAARCASLGCPVDASNINKAENRNRGIGGSKLPVLAQALGLDVDDLLSEAA